MTINDFDPQEQIFKTNGTRYSIKQNFFWKKNFKTKKKLFKSKKKSTQQNFFWKKNFKTMKKFISQQDLGTSLTRNNMKSEKRKQKSERQKRKT